MTYFLLWLQSKAGNKQLYRVVFTQKGGDILVRIEGKGEYEIS